MFPFKIHSFDLGGRQYILLPKLNPSQMKMLAVRLERRGYSVRLSSLLTARAAKSSLRVDPSGICWSSVDPGDAILPAIPDLLSCPKEHVSRAGLEALYFTHPSRGAAPVVRVSARMECSSLWDALRASGECGLTPDERAVALLLLARAEGPCRMLTDFPGLDPVPHICGRRRYFESSLDSEEAGQTLREAGCRAPRNSYLPRDGVLEFPRRFSLSPHELGETLQRFDEWCFFASG